MTDIRPQYHFRETPHGLDAWSVQRLVELTKGFRVKKVDPSSFPELHTNHWYKEDSQIPTPASMIEHMLLIQQCDLSFPIILDAKGRVMDGMHRICKALMTGVDQIDAVQFEHDPEPDYTNCVAAELPYED